MPQKGKTYEQKLSAVKDYLEGKKSMNQIAIDNCVSFNTAKQWVFLYQSLGTEGLICQSKNASYSKEFKLKIVREYLDGTGSLFSICKKYGVRSTRQLRNWIMKYNSHEELKAYGNGGTPIMTNGRKTTYDERVEIVKYCIENQNNYTETAQKYQVSYQQVYTWINKYEDYGIEGLYDGRGKRKNERELSELEKLKAQNKLLEAQNRRQQMEIDFLKKLDQIERRRY
ncbi:IS3 family transposase ISEnfa5 [bioreactor metagenome]|uniref:IS3 family transposase ISEnfa5 n=1 Tax=bioreactor metagenome TaxID=1076179 RepID=A0A644ZEI3_9ZZZZ|nr:transposase [Lachnospiraceae bacterium]